MSLQTIPTDVHVKGRFTCKSMAVPDDTIDDEAVAADAGIQATKLEHDHLKVYAQEAATNAFAEERVIHVAGNDGEVVAFSAGVVVKPDTALAGGRSAVVDFKKNGVSILSATIVLDNGDTNYIAVDATLTAGAEYSAGDVFTVAVTLGAGTTGTHAKGVFAQASFREIAA